MQIDSNFTKEEAISANPKNNCPQEILDSQVLLTVFYFNFEGIECSGQIIVNKKVEDDIKKVFELIHEIKFPLARVVPVVKYAWDDGLSCKNNNTSAFNYRMKVGKIPPELSNHSLGFTIDFNPLQNPYIKYDSEGKEVLRDPVGSVYDVNNVGTLYPDHEIVILMKSLGWKWGGDWENPKDYQHFEKVVQ